MNYCMCTGCRLAKGTIIIIIVTTVCFREGFRQERVRLTEKVERLENELALMRVTLQKETEYKENMEKSHHSLLLEQRELQAQYVDMSRTLNLTELATLPQLVNSFTATD